MRYFPKILKLRGGHKGSDTSYTIVFPHKLVKKHKLDKDPEFENIFHVRKIKLD